MAKKPNKSAEEMFSISHSNSGRKDGGYTRLLGNEDLGALLSRVQGTIISSGKGLEKIVYEQLIKNDRVFKGFHSFENLKKLLPKDQIYALDIPTLEKSDMLPKEKNDKGNYSITKQDFYFISSKNKTLFLIELKDGDTFDTKKAKSEKDVLELSNKFFEKKFKEYTIENWFVSFNQSSVLNIYNGSKGKIPQNWCKTGKEFCEKFSIDKIQIEKLRQKWTKANEDFFLTQIELIKNK